ncbi:MAG: NDP-sugar synthase [Candidatus Nitrohelix vancouverensis]|uniref:NDP-sugar synthase n=1 Tax=Candidatus Nitrohelix vancouverensis TaxID=2705534 RepID=A0A7T0G4L2_9BACT|nr:MAG: NDP-sugar synthase [Candidatus Nitrohelix vancouverensis]
MKAMILAAGFGKRLQPLTDLIPKPMMPVLNRPLLTHTLDILRAAGIHEAVVNLHHLPQTVVDYFESSRQDDIRLNFLVEEKIMGTGGGIKAAQKFLDDGEPFVVINSDNLSDVSLNDAIQFHRQQKALLTLVVRRFGPDESYRRIEIDAKGRIVHFLDTEPPGQAALPLTRVMFTGIQIVDPVLFDFIPENTFCGTTEDIYPKLIEQGLNVSGYLHEGYWIDAGTRDAYLQTNFDALDGKLPSSQRDATQAESSVLIGKECRIAPDCEIGPHVVLGDGCIVESGVRISRSVCWDGVHLKKNCQIENCILTSNAEAAEGLQLQGQTVLPR